jgi:hypothetical protein
VQDPCVGLITERVVEDPHQAIPDVGIVDGDDHLHPPVEVPLHQVGRSDAHP